MPELEGTMKPGERPRTVLRRLARKGKCALQYIRNPKTGVITLAPASRFYYGGPSPLSHKHRRQCRPDVLPAKEKTDDRT